jgi:hypothetical protein
MPEDVTVGSEIITIVDSNRESVTFDLEVFDDLDMIAVSYRELDQSLICDQRFNVSAGDSIQYKGACVDNFSSLTVFMYIGDEFDIEDCDACKVPDGEVDGYIAIYFELPCISSCETLEPDLPASIPVGPECNTVIMASHKGEDQMCEHSPQPFTVEEFDEGSNEVRFSFTNDWPADADIELFYDRGDGSPQCLSLNLLSPGTKYPNTLAAICDPGTHTADIEVYFTNASHSSDREKCGDPGPGSCSYMYTIPCSKDILCDGVRRLENVKDETNSFVVGNVNNEQGFMTEEMRVAGEISEDSEDAPYYCIHEDYPCKGDEEKMVYVCHYSSRTGYQTFCIPEMDSDILRFNQNHHCGPCDGWNGIDNTGQMI